MPDPAVPTPPVTGDTAAAPTAPPVAPDAAAAQTNDPVADATTNLTHAVKVAPALLKAPAAAYDVATAGGDIDSSAQAASLQGSRHVAAQTAAVTAQAHSDHPGGLWGVLDDLGHRVAHDTAQVYEDPAKVLELPLDALNVGMKESQHQFRYLYDVYQRHGLMAALGETMVMLAAGAAGVAVTAGGILGTPFTGGASDVAAGAADAALAGGVEGAEVGLEGTAEGAVEDTAEQAAAKTAQKSLLRRGLDLQNRLHGKFEFLAPAQAAGYAESHAIYTDSWNRTANPQYKNKAGVLVNPGNVMDGFLGLKGGLLGNALSGVTNGIYDMFTDPEYAAMSDWSDARKAVTDVTKQIGWGAAKVYNRSMDADEITAAIERARAGTGSTADNAALEEVRWLSRASTADILRRHPDWESIVGTISKAGESAQPDEDLVSRYDESPKPMNPEHPQGAYGTPDGSPTSYGIHGGARSEFFINHSNQLQLTTSPGPDPAGWNAGTAAIEALAGPDTLQRLKALAARDPRLVVDEINEKWPELHLPYTTTGQELDVYAAQLARDRGYTSMKYVSQQNGYGDEIVALKQGALRYPGEPVRVKGLGDAKTEDEVMDILTDSTLQKEALGLRAPSMTRLGKRMEALRVKSLAAPKDTLHPILGSLRHPSTALGNIGLLTSRDVEKGVALNPTNLLGLENWRRQLQNSGMAPELVEKLIDGFTHGDVGARTLIYQNGQFMSLLAHAGVLKAPEDLADAEWFDRIQQALKDAKAGKDPDAALSRVEREWLARLAKKPKFREFVLEQISNIAKMAENSDPDAMGLFEATENGTTPAPYIDGERRFAGAILSNQTGDLPIMNWSEMHHAAQKVAGRMRFTGDLDDFLMTHITDPVFKRWVLVSLGYALHVSASEIALNSVRGGVFKGAYLTMLARMGERVKDLDPEQIMSMHSAVLNLVGQAHSVPEAAKSFGKISALLTSVSAHGKVLLNREDEHELQMLMVWTEGTHGQMAGERMLPHGSTIDNLSDVGATKNAFDGMFDQSRMMHGDRFVNYGPESDQHLPSWAQHLGVTAADEHSPAAAKAAEAAYAAGGTRADAYDAAQKAALKSIEDMDPVTRSFFKADTLKRDGDPASMTPHESWSHHIAGNMMAITHAPNGGEVLEGSRGSLLHNIAEARPTYPKEIRAIPTELRPLGVPGRELIKAPGDGVVAHLAGGIYKGILNPTIKALSRQGIAYAEFRKEYIAGLGAVAKGTMTYDEMVPKALAQADINALRFVHNVNDRTVLDQMMRNWVPFFFAQEQAYRRMGRLLAEDPAAFRRYELMLQSAHNIVSKQVDGSGNQYFALPGAGFLDSQTTRAFGLIGVPLANLNPTGFGGTLSAASVVFPAANGVRPDFSPVVTISAQAVRNIFEEWGAKYSTFKPVVNVVQGGLNEALGSENMQESILQQVIPNTTAYRFIEAAEGNDTSFNSAMMLTMQSLAYSQNVAMEKWRNEGSKGPEPDIIPPPDASPEQLQAFLSKVKNQTRIVFLQRAILGAVSPVSADVTVNDFGLNAKLQADINSSKSVDAGFQKFLLANPNATPYTTAESTTATGKSLPDTQGALDWIESNSSLLNKYQYGGMWLMPNLKDNTYSSSAYYNEIADGLRQRLAPSAYLNALYTANGDQTYYTALAEHEAIIAGAGSGSAAESQEYARWDAYMQHLQATQPIWWASYNSGTRQSDAQQSINQLTEIYAKGLEPKTQQSEDVGNLLTAFQSAESQYVQAGTQSNYSTAQKQISDSWINYCDQLALQEPQLASVISSVFRDGLVYMNQT